MLKQFRYFIAALLLVFSLSSRAQQNRIDSLHTALKNLSGKTGYKADTSRYRTIMSIAKYWQVVNADSALFYHSKAEKIAAPLNDELMKAELLNGLAWDNYALGNSEKAEKLYGQAFDIVKKELQNTNQKKQNKVLLLQSSILANKGILHGNSGEIEKALDCYEQAFKIKRKINDKRGQAITSNNLGNLYLDQSNYPKALEYFYASLKISNEIGLKVMKASSLSNIGIVYLNQKENAKALKYFEEALALANEMDNNMNKSATLTNIGIIYHNMHDFDKALKYYNEALKYDQASGTKTQGSNLTNIGAVYADLKQYTPALKYYEEAKKTYEKYGNKYGYAISCNNLGMIQIQLKQYRKAEQYLMEGQKAAREIQALSLLKDNHGHLGVLYEETNQPGKALYHYKQHIAFRDSIFNEENTKANIQKEIQFNYDKKAAADSIAFTLKLASEKKIKDAEIAKGEAELKAKKFQQYILFGGLALVIVFSFFMYNRFRITQKQKLVIEQKEKETSLQKQVIEEKHREITDSINYAERIQRSFLASKQTLDENLGDYFLLFQPKDVVSGDFYWAYKPVKGTQYPVPGLEQKNDPGKQETTEYGVPGTFLLACADSTGHGVPGAIMSILNITCLEKAALHSTVPSQILDNTRNMIIEHLKKDGSSEGGKDGMDCALLNLDLPNKRLQFALANNPLWLVREGKMHEFEADKMPVGKYEKQETPFTLHQTDLQAGDTIYIFTDGYADQFGGDRGKKMKHTSLKKMLLENSHETMSAQYQILQRSFESWKGDLEQVDDVCIIGIKIS